MLWLHWMTIALAITEAGWMAFDGSRALLVGDYITTSRGARAGQLGPWAELVAKAGIEPRSALMRAIFMIYGFVWLRLIICFAMGKPWAWTAMLIAALGSLWYLPIGTAVSSALIILLLLQSH